MEIAGSMVLNEFYYEEDILNFYLASNQKQYLKLD